MPQPLSFDHLQALLRQYTAGLPDVRKPSPNTRYTIQNAALGAFGIFFMQSPSFLEYQRQLKQCQGHDNAQTLFGVEPIPCDNQIRKLLDPIAPHYCAPVFFEGFAHLEQQRWLEPFRVLDHQLLVSLDGTQYFSFQALHCRNCLTRQLSNGQPLYYHTAITPVIVCPGHAQVIALAPEYIMPQDGHAKQDCEQAAGKRWMTQHAATLVPHHVTLLGDDLYSKAPFCALALHQGFNFILVCKPDSHPKLYERLAFWQAQGAITQCEQRRRKGRVTEVAIYRFINEVLLQGGKHALAVNWVEMTVMDQRWQMVLDCLGAEQPPFSQGTLCNFRMRLIAHNLDKTLLERTVALAETTGGFGARQRRAVLDSPPLCGAGRVEDPLNLLGHALRQAVGLAAQALGTSAEAVVEDAGLTLVGHRSLKAALDLGLEEVTRWHRWLAQQQTLAAEPPPLKEVMETITQIITQDTEPAPGGGPGGRRLKQHVAPDRCISIEDHDIRHGRKSRATTCNGFNEHCAVDVASKVIREVVVRPAHEPEHEAVELLAAELEKAPGLLQLASDLGYMASPRMAQWAAQGVYMIARPWPQVGPLFTQHDFTLDFAGMQVTCPGGQSVPRVLGKPAQLPAAACAGCALRTQCTKATHGQGKSLSIREDEPFQQKLRTKMKTQRGRASRRKRTAVEHAMAHQLAHQGRRARYKGVRKNQFDGRRHAAVSNLQVAAHYKGCVLHFTHAAAQAFADLSR